VLERDVDRGPAEAFQVSQRILDGAAWRGECAVSVARALFCALGLTRYIAINHLSRLEFAAPYLMGVVCSTFVLARRRTAPNVPFLYASVIFDWALCMLALLPDVLWHPPGYTGVANRPDLAVVYILVVASSFRLQPAACWIATGLYATSCGALIALDGELTGIDWGWRGSGISMILLLTLSSGLLAYQLATRTRRLVLAGAIETWRNIQAERTFAVLAEEGHDARSLLSAARLDADQLLERISSGSWSGVVEMAQRLRDQVIHVVKLAAHSRDRSFIELARLEPIDLGRLAARARDVASIVGARFPRVTIELGGELRPGNVVLLGGVAAFERILLNIVTNACEGDGKNAALRVTVHFSDSPGNVSMTVEDDGPGFSREILRQQSRAQDALSKLNCVTTKPHGSGLGLYFVARLVRVSGGELEWGNRNERGARVTVRLRKRDAVSVVNAPGGVMEASAAGFEGIAFEGPVEARRG
jgi:signal transduction histidine kinase